MKAPAGVLQTETLGLDEKPFDQALSPPYSATMTPPTTTMPPKTGAKPFIDAGIQPGISPEFQNRRGFLDACAQGVGMAGLAALSGETFGLRSLGADTVPKPAFGLPKRWSRELIRRGTDPLCGSEIWQLTSAAAISHNIYGEQLYCSADGTRIAFLRLSNTNVHDGPMELFVVDLNKRGVMRIGDAAFFLVAGNGLGNTLFYVRRDDKGAHPIMRVDFTTLEQTEVFRFGECPTPVSRGLLAVSPDERYCMILRRLGERRYGIERIDFRTGKWDLIHENDDIFNAHLQFSPAGGELMVQHNRGGLLDNQYNAVRSVGPKGATLYVIDQDGKNQRSLPIGTPHTTPVTGHECWIGKTGRVLLTTHGGKVYVAAPGDKKATLIARGNGYMHISASPDGKFYVVDDIKSGRLHIGCIATQRVLPLYDTQASGGYPQYTHTHPYITPGNHRVVFNSDRTGIAQVYTARIPPELLEKLQTA